MIYFVESVNKSVVHTTDHNLHIAVGEHVICPGSQREYKAIGVISNLGTTDKTVVLQPVSHSQLQFKEYLQTGGV
jgi:hypothetical protein